MISSVRCHTLFLSLVVSAALMSGCALSVFPGSEPPSIPPPPSQAPAIDSPMPVEGEGARIGDYAEVNRWAVQVASLKDRSAAHQAQVGLAERSFPAYVLTYPTPDGTWYRVRIGPFGDRGSVEAIAETLEDFGYSTWIVPEE